MPDKGADLLLGFLGGPGTGSQEAVVKGPGMMMLDG
jgi:hypothetical protein